MQVAPDGERKIITILKVLSESTEPLGSTTIARQLERHGIFLSERAVRYHLRISDERGYTEPMGHDGRMITPRGQEELRLALAPEQVGLLQDKLELLAFHTTFDPVRKTGLLPVNATMIARDKFPAALDAMSAAFESGLCVSHLVATAQEGEKLGSVVVPAGKIGFATVCSVVANGVLLKAGIPVQSRFGGVLEIIASKPRRFVAIIHYAGTSLDPSEQYINAKMTSVREVARSGQGKILANFRDIPAPARSIAAEVADSLNKAGINAIYTMGNTSDPVCQTPVALNRVGMVMLGGLNPVAAAFEAGIDMDNIAESGMIDFQQLTSFWKLKT
ncbi:MAG: DUF128 domain-containing protein [Chloroflexi bacterium]|nr:DUF128 domain-containing protein [Chloroflexota bacterium]